jgi:transcription-repair coupling factor (superfamily II helicase)
MKLHDLPGKIDRLEGFDDLLMALKASHGQMKVVGLAGAAKALFFARIFQREQLRALVVVSQTEHAQNLFDDLIAFGIPEQLIYQLPSTESPRLTGETTDFRTIGERIMALSALASGSPCIVIGTGESVFQRTGPPNEMVEDSFFLSRGESIHLEEILKKLVEIGYEADTTVSRPGQFSRRGGIIDIFPSSAEQPIRMDLFGDEIESLRYFDVSSQRSTKECDQIYISPAREVRLNTARVINAIQTIRTLLNSRLRQLAASRDRPAFDTLSSRIEDDLSLLQNGVYFNALEEYLPYLAPENTCALDYLLYHPNDVAPEDIPSLVIVDEPGQIGLHCKRTGEEIAESRDRRYSRGELLQGSDYIYRSPNGLERIAQEFSSLTHSLFPHKEDHFIPKKTISLSTAPMESWRSRLNYFADEIQIWTGNGAECLLISDQPQRLREICNELHLPLLDASEQDGYSANLQTNGVKIIEGRLREGFKFADIGLFIATDAELFGSARAVPIHRRATGGIPVSTILDLRTGDYVVHVQHGIGKYRGLVKRDIDGAARDFLHIEYLGGSLYVPADQIDRVQRFIGGDGAPPAINKIGGNEWQRTTRRVREQARIMARDLIQLYAARQAAERPTLTEDSLWQIEMEEAFPYEETPGQLRAILDVKSDLASNRPMDRLVCGDVGFGKTEVAIRAAFKMADAGKQVAVLCPTTVLAAQHHTTFTERLAAYPLSIELLSRFRNRSQIKETLDRIKSGNCEIVIGTHRLLSKDVEFHNLGMIIVDEEQRFGVAHKERLKQLRASVDVLTLTATPIPRTLSMALSGLRDMSVIEDPPGGRMPITTFVREYDEEMIRDAISRELERDGQVYFVHNRVESIEYVAERIRKLAPNARVRVGHGQMSEDELEQIMFDFYHRKFDILVCTTIIENGLDVANANTLIIDRADHMGLAQLYQIRGRVGRSSRQAYAYLLYRRNKQLSEDAERRLMAIREFTALGSGFQVAMRDLEIRGAGNLLGAEQSGAMVTVGFDLYCQLLAEAVAELKGEEPQDETLPPVDIPVTAHIPESYIPNEAERIYFYKKMASVTSLQAIEELREELEDRYGDPPQPVWKALAILRLRLRCRAIGIAAIRGERKEITIRFGSHVRLTPDAIRLLSYMFKKHRFTGDSVIITLSTPKVMEEVEEMMDVLEKALKEGPSINPALPLKNK